jgi:hypothetical protein
MQISCELAVGPLAMTKPAQVLVYTTPPQS